MTHTHMMLAPAENRRESDARFHLSAPLKAITSNLMKLGVKQDYGNENTYFNTEYKRDHILKVMNLPSLLEQF